MWCRIVTDICFTLSVPPLTQNLVSQSFQAADIMSQRACSQQLAVQVIDISRSSSDYLCLHAIGHKWRLMMRK